ncbi:MAG: helix-turn-helix transcriptional regulator [Pontiella sp.]
MEQTSLNIGTIGQKLESARQAKGVTVSEAGRATKILSKFIEAMEADDFGVLSAPVYAKSFIKMYAKYLGLDARPLVEEYVVQHSDMDVPQLSNEVRQNLANVDNLSADGSAAPSSNVNSGNIFGNVNEAITRLSGSGFPLKMVLSAVGAIILLSIIVFSVTQCADEEAEPSAAGGAASMERQLITDSIPNAYLVTRGVVEVEK